MKIMSLNQMEELQGGSFWRGFCDAVNVADLVAGGLGAAAEIGLIAVQFGPGAGYALLGLVAVNAACAIW